MSFLFFFPTLFYVAYGAWLNLQAVLLLLFSVLLWLAFYEAVLHWTGLPSGWLFMFKCEQYGENTRRNIPMCFYRQNRCKQHPPVTHLSSGGCWLTGCILVDDGDRLPLVELHDVQHGSADGGVLGVEVDVEAVLVVHRRVFPACLDVRDFQGVADRLDRADGGAVRGAEYGTDTQSQLVARWAGEGRRETKQEVRLYAKKIFFSIVLC